MATVSVPDSEVTKVSGSFRGNMQVIFVDLTAEGCRRVRRALRMEKEDGTPEKPGLWLDSESGGESARVGWGLLA